MHSFMSLKRYLSLFFFYRCLVLRKLNGEPHLVQPHVQEVPTGVQTDSVSLREGVGVRARPQRVPLHAVVRDDGDGVHQPQTHPERQAEGVLRLGSGHVPLVIFCVIRCSRSRS